MCSFLEGFNKVCRIVIITIVIIINEIIIIIITTIIISKVNRTNWVPIRSDLFNHEYAYRPN